MMDTSGSTYMEPIDSSEKQQEQQTLADLLNLLSSETTYCNTRDKLDKQLSIEMRFGNQLVDLAKRIKRNGIKTISQREKESISSINPVREIQIFNYAGTVFFAYNHSVDGQLRDEESLYLQDILPAALMDPKCSIDVVLTQPESSAVEDTEKYKKLGNPNLTHREVFTSSFANLYLFISTRGMPQHIAHGQRRFTVRITDMSMPYAIFSIKYKEKWKEEGFANHQKIDLYSPYIATTKDRPSIIIFEDNQTILYGHFTKIFDQIKQDRNNSEMLDLPETRRNEYIKAWENSEKASREKEAIDKYMELWQDSEQK